MVLVRGDNQTSNHVEIMEEESASDTLPDSQRITVDLPLNNGAGAESIRINHGGIDGALLIDINRTVRVPDNRDTNMLPPGLGPFPLFKVQDHASKMPADMAKKGGLFFPMYQREAMWLSFRAELPFALKMYVGGVNAVSGIPLVENERTQRKQQLQMMERGEQVQDYMVVPGQRWLDGIVAEDGKIRQFVAQPKGSGFSVEAQVTGEETVGGIQIEVIPVRRILLDAIDVRYENAEAQAIKRTLKLAEKGLDSKSTWLDLKKVLREEFDIAVDNQILNPYPPGDGSHLRMGDDAKLGESYFKPNFTLELRNLAHISNARPALSSRGGACYMMKAAESVSASAQPPPPPPGAPSGMATLSAASPAATRCKSKKKSSPAVKEMGIAAGGSIQQTIAPDPYPAGAWDVSASIMLNIQILDSEAFSEVTGLPAPPTPVDAKTYADYGYPFFELWGEEKTGVWGDFSGVKSVAQIEAERAAGRGEGVWEEEESVPQRVFVIGRFRSTFRPVDVLTKELEELRVGSG